jgi:hypothetical protein
VDRTGPHGWRQRLLLLAARRDDPPPNVGTRCAPPPSWETYMNFKDSDYD